MSSIPRTELRCSAYTPAAWLAEEKTPLYCSDPIDKKGTMIKVTCCCMTAAHCIDNLLPSLVFLIRNTLLSLEAWSNTSDCMVITCYAYELVIPNTSFKHPQNVLVFRNYREESFNRCIGNYFDEFGIRCIVNIYSGTKTTPINYCSIFVSDMLFLFIFQGFFRTTITTDSLCVKQVATAQ